MRRGVRLAFVCLPLLGACLFPSLDDLTGNAPVDAAPIDAAPVDAAEEGSCPPNTDPTLLGYWRLDEGSGTAVHDCSGHGFDGLILSTPDGGSWAPGHEGTALRVNGTSGCVEIGSPPALALTDAVTVMAWVNVDAFALGYIVGKSRDTTVRGFRLATGSPSLFRFDIPGPGDAAVVAMTGKEDAGVWTHVAATFAATGTIAVYVDGVLANASPAIGPILDDTSATVRIGCRADSTSYFQGVLDDVRIYGRALDASEIAVIAAE